MKSRHEYQVAIEWQGNTGSGTQTYSSYERTYSIQASSRSTIAGSSDPKFRGDPAFWSPENLLVASLSACHQLWYLSLCAKAGIVVAAYEDVAVGIMIEDEEWWRTVRAYRRAEDLSRFKEGLRRAGLPE